MNVRCYRFPGSYWRRQVSKMRGWDLAECGWYLAERGWDLAEWLERLTANAVALTVLGSISAFSDTVDSEGWQMKQCWISYIKKEKIQKNPPFKKGARTNYYRFDRICGDCLKLRVPKLRASPSCAALSNSLKWGNHHEPTRKGGVGLFLFPPPPLIALLKISTICDDSTIY